MKNSRFFAQAKGAKKGELYILDAIWCCGVTPAGFLQELNSLGDVDDIDLIINSPGGVCADGFAIYYMLQNHKARKHAKIYGRADSMSSVLAASCDTVEMGKYSRWMIHEAWNCTQGPASEHLKSAAVLMALNESMVDIYSKRYKGSKDELRALMAVETDFGADQAVAWGFADSIFDDDIQAAAYSGDVKSLLTANKPNPSPKGQTMPPTQEEMDAAIAKAKADAKADAQARLDRFAALAKSDGLDFAQANVDKPEVEVVKAQLAAAQAKNVDLAAKLAAAPSAVPPTPNSELRTPNFPQAPVGFVPGDDQGSKPPRALTAAEKSICKAGGVKPEDYLKQLDHKED